MFIQLRYVFMHCGFVVYICLGTKFTFVMKKKNHVLLEVKKISFFIFTFVLPWEATFDPNVISKSNPNRHFN